MPAAAAAYTALVVEDSPAMRRLVTFALSRIPGVTVVEAEDGAEALHKLDGAHFDVVLADINMPILDGLKLIKRIRADARHRDVPIIVITTEHGEEDRRRALALGATSYLTKPAQSHQIVAAVRAALGLDAG